MRIKNNYEYREGISLKIYPSKKQKDIISLNDGIARFIYNRLVAVGKELFLMRNALEKVPRYQERTDYLKSTIKNTSTIRNAVPFLNNPLVDSCAIANAKANYNQAWENFKKNPKSGVPAFHKKGYAKSYQTNAVYSGETSLKTGSVRLTDKSHIQLPKLGIIRFSGSKKRIDKLFKNSKDIKIGTVTVKMDATGAYYVSLQLASNTSFVGTIPKTKKSVGIDVNLRNYLTDSNRNVVDNPKYYKNAKEKLAKEQRICSRRLKGVKKNTDPRNKNRYINAKNYQKQRVKVAEIHKKISNQRKDFLHKLSTEYVKSHDIIVVENIKPSNMKKNHRLAQAISDASWSTFLSMLEYKAQRYGKVFIKVPPQYTTQTCNVCGHVNKGKDRLTLAIEEWVCPQCGTFHIRDVNAAIVILQRGLEILLGKEGLSA